MKLKRFTEKSLIMGAFLASQSLQAWLKSNIISNSDLSFLGHLILIAIYYEDKSQKVGPSRLASTLGFSRSRISQEISHLTKSGYLKRALSSDDARGITLSLSSIGEKQALDAIKAFTRLQNIIDRTTGEREAEKMNESLLLLVTALKDKI